MAEFISFLIGAVFTWGLYRFWAIPKWHTHFRHRRGVPRLSDIWKEKP